MGRLWVAGLVIVFALTGPCYGNSSEAGKANETVGVVSETTTELDEDEHEQLPDAEPLIGDHEWVEIPDDGTEDDGTDDEGDDIEAAGSEVVSTVVKHDENGQVVGEEPGMRRRRKKGRKRRRRMRKRPRTTTSGPAVEGEIYPTPAPGATEEHPEPEKAPVQEEAPSPKENEGEQAYPRRRPGKRRRRPRPSTEAPEPQEIQDNRSPDPESPVPEVVSEEPSSPRPRRRKRPKNRNRVPVEVPETGVPNAEEIPPKTEPVLPENHKQYETSTLKPKDAEDFAPVTRLKGNVDNSIQFGPPPSSKETFGGDQKVYAEQSSREASRFNGNENLKVSERQNVRKPVTNKPLVISTEYPTVEQKLKDYPAVEHRPKDYSKIEQRPKDYSTTGQKLKDFPIAEQKPRDYLPIEQKPKDYPIVEQKFKDFSPPGQKLKDFPAVEQKPKDYQSFGPTNRPNSNKQLFQPQNTKFVELNPLNIDHNKYPSASPGPQTISFKTNGYDGFQQFQKLYGDDPGFNNTQLNRLKISEPTRAQTDKALKPTAPSRNQNENIEDKFQQSAPSKFSNQPPTSKVPDNNYSNYGQGYGLTKPTHGSLFHTQKNVRPEQDRPNHSEQFPIPNKFPHQKPQVINIPQAPPQYNKPKLIGMKEPESQSTTYKPTFAAKPQNENPLIIQNRPVENQYTKSQTKANNFPPQESINTAQRSKGNQPGNNYDAPAKGVKSENPFLINTRFPNIPQQNILRQIASQNPQFPAQASVLVSDDIETNSAKPNFNNNINDLNNKLKPPQSIEQFNHQLVDPTLLTSPVLFEPQLPPVFEDDVPATKSTVSKVQLPPIQYPKAKFPPAPFLPSSQKQLPNTQFQRQAEPAPFRLPQKPELSSTSITLPTQGTFQQPFSNKKAPPQILPTVQSQNEKEINKQVLRKPEPELDDEEIKPFVPASNVQPTTTVESETISYVETQTTKTPDLTTRKSLFNQAKRLPPTSAVIRRKVRPRPLKNITTENTQTTAAENLSEKYRGTGHRSKNTYRQHLTEVDPSKVPEFDIEQDGNEDGLKPSSVYGDDGQLTQEQETPNVRYHQEKTRYTTSYPETSADETTSAKPGRFGLHHVSAQQEILRQTLQKQGKDPIREEESTNPPFVPYKSSDEVEIPEESFPESNPTPAFTTSKKTYSFTPRKPGHRHRTKGHNTPVTTPTTPRYTSLEIITDKPKYSATDEYEFMVSDEELLKMMKPMMGDDFADQRDTEDLRFKAANIHGVKDEILDLIKTDSGSARLSRILKLRNMSLDDLIKHRERGSSQLHLSEIFTRKKEYEIESTAQPRPTEIFSVPGFPQNSEDDVAAQITPIFESNYIKNKGELDTIRNTAIVTEIKTSSNYGGNQFEDDRDNNREPKVFESMPSFTLRTDILEKINERKENPAQKTDTSWRFFGQVSKPQRPYEDVVISYTSTNRYPYRKPSVEEIDDIILLSDTEQYDAPRSNVIHAKVLADSGGERRDQEFFNETKKLSTGVKSAILVSGAIIGIAVLGFFALMISCRIKQKKARLRAQRDILCDHFHEELRSSARSTSPVMPEENTCEHGVRSTAIPTRHYNNRHYYLWRTLRKTFQYE